jgi:hypothetical protein
MTFGRERFIVEPIDGGAVAARYARRFTTA